jgi:ribosomal protein S18 acetylase RimI-like enzyme
LRGRGAGQLLMERLQEECRQQGYSGLVWQVLDWNEPAIRFYQKLGHVRFDREWVNCSIETQ